MKTTRFSLSNLLLLLAAWMPGFAAAQTNLGEYEDLCLDTESLPFLGIDEDFELLTIQHMGEPRSVFVHVPETNATGPLPMVMDVHGMGGCPSFQMAMTGWLGLAGANDYVYVAPLGRTDPSVSMASCWSVPGGREIKFKETTVTPPCCCTTDNSYKTWSDYETLQDDVFLRNAIKYLTTDGALDDVTLDPSKIVVTGHSNGGMAAFALAARHSDVISGIAVYGGSANTPFADDYSPIPVVIVHGKKDGEAPYDGMPTPYGYGFDSTENIFSMVADKNGCDAEIVNEPLEAENGVLMKRTNCTNDADVTLVVLDKGGHNPYKGADLMWNDGWGAKKTVVDTTQMACKALFGDDCANDVPGSESGAVYRNTGVVGAFALLLSLLWL
mmetsp:Transcript_37762/g.42273  ORF Transcript_37762/g.42273 Transcript_37762/m.42273 type:complete len:385 (-) Transcript_37762:13-1167(-)